MDLTSSDAVKVVGEGPQRVKRVQLVVESRRLYRTKPWYGFRALADRTAYIVIVSRCVRSSGPYRIFTTHRRDDRRYFRRRTFYECFL